MIFPILFFSCLTLFAGAGLAENFTIIGGQIYTPGLAIIDSPQPDTPLGGDTLQVALDISGDGKLQLPPYPSGSPTEIYNITIFLSSYVTGLNLTISNGTATAGNASLGDILLQEPSSTVKHVNWVWPACLVGNGAPTSSSSDRGDYNLNGTDFYTIFNLPIAVTNSISSTTSSGSRTPCSALSNPLIPYADLQASADTIAPAQYPWTNGNGAQVSVSGTGSNSASSTNGASSSAASRVGVTGLDLGLLSVGSLVMWAALWGSVAV